MPRSASARVIILLGAVAIPHAASADDYSIHVLGHVQTAWTDNLFAAAEDSDPGPESDFSTQIRPGALVSYETPRTIHQLSYDLEANLYASHREAWSLNHVAGWRGFFLTSPRTELQTSVLFTTGTLAALAARTEANPQPPQQQLGGDGQNQFWALEAAEGLSFTASPALRLSQGARARRFATTNALGVESGGSEVGVSAGADRGWQHSAVAILGSAAYVTLDQGPTTIDTVNGSLVVSYRRDFSLRWTALLDGGVAAVIPIDGEVFVQPTIGTNIGYAPEWGAASLQLRRSIAPNLYIAQNTVTDSAMITAALPLPWLTDDPLQPKLTTAGGLGISRTQQIVGDSLQSATDVASLDLAVQYNPRPGLGFAVRGQHLRQIGEDTGGMTMGTPTVDYNRTTLMVSATWRFPDRLAAEIPTRDSLRVDRSDNTPVGEERAPVLAP